MKKTFGLFIMLFTLMLASYGGSINYLDVDCD